MGEMEKVAIDAAIADGVKLCQDLSDALRAVAVASQMAVEALERIENDLLSFSALTD